jgi:hypothetical protein
MTYPVVAKAVRSAWRRPSTSSAARAPLSGAANLRAAARVAPSLRTRLRAWAISAASASGDRASPDATRPHPVGIARLITPLRDADEWDAVGRRGRDGAQAAMTDDGRHVRQHAIAWHEAADEHVAGDRDGLDRRDPADGEQGSDGQGADRLENGGQRLLLVLCRGAQADEHPRPGCSSSGNPAVVAPAGGRMGPTKVVLAGRAWGRSSKSGAEVERGAECSRHRPT